MSVKRSFEPWEEVQRQGQDFVDSFAQIFTVFQSHFTPPSFPWPNAQTPKLEFPAQSFVKRSFEPWEEVQRQGQDFVDSFAQIFTVFQSHFTPPSFPWPNAQTPKLEFPAQSFVNRDFGLAVDCSAINGVSAIFDFGNRIGQVGVDFGACVNGMVQQFFRRLPVPFWHDENMGISLRREANVQRNDVGVSSQEDLGSLAERFRDYGFTENKLILENSRDEENVGVDAKTSRLFGRSQGAINFTSTYESRTRNVESSLVARGDLWRVEASQGGATSGSENSFLFLAQLGPLLFVRDSTLLLPIHLLKQHLLCYGYDRKHGMHSLCPAMWSKQRRWLLLSVICLNPLDCYGKERGSMKIVVQMISSLLLGHKNPDKKEECIRGIN